MIGNGEKLPTKHIGKANIYTPRNQKLALNRVLYVPKITKNFLSISQLTSFNNIEVIFNSSCYFMMDKATGKVLLLRKLKDGLYCLGSLKPIGFPHRPCQALITSQNNLRQFLNP